MTSLYLQGAQTAQVVYSSSLCVGCLSPLPFLFIQLQSLKGRMFAIWLWMVKNETFVFRYAQDFVSKCFQNVRSKNKRKFITCQFTCYEEVVSWKSRNYSRKLS